MGARRTDLALEARELWRESAGETTRLPGVEAREREREGFPVTEIRVLDRRGERALGKPPGRYVTLTLPGHLEVAVGDRANLATPTQDYLDRFIYQVRLQLSEEGATTALTLLDRDFI